MATRLTLGIRFEPENGNYKPGAINITNDQVTLNAEGADERIVSVGVSETTITFGVTTYGYLFIRNLDDTNYLEYGPDSAGLVAIGRLKAGESAVLRVKPGITFKAQANAAACNVWLRMVND